MDRRALAMSEDRLTVACVEVGDYGGRGLEYVQRLRAAVARHLPVPHRFVCLSDRPHPGIATVPADPALPGWWAKLALFAPGRIAGARVVYFDLDTVILGDLTPLAAVPDAFGILRDVWRPAIGQSAVMTWSAGWGGHLWAEGRAAAATLDPRRRMDPWLAARTPARAALQDRLPGFFRSYKAEAREGPGPAHVVYFHGQPRPHAAEGWAGAAWRAAA